jgi:hypothetical protein
MVMRKQYWTVQIFYHKRPRQGHCLELDYNDKTTAIQHAVSWRDLGYTVKINAGTDLPLSFRDPRDEMLDEIEEPVAPMKRGRKAKYL